MHFCVNFGFSKFLSTLKMPSAIIAATFDAHDTQVSAFTYRLEVDWEGFAKAVAVI